MTSDNKTNLVNFIHFCTRKAKEAIEQYIIMDGSKGCTLAKDKLEEIFERNYVVVT